MNRIGFGFLSGFVRYAAVVLSTIAYTNGVLAGPDLPISLRLVDAKTQKPTEKVTAFLITWDKRGHVQILSKGLTNADGTVLFRLVEPLPDRIGFTFSPDEVKNCSDLAFSIEDVTRLGVVARNTCVTDDSKPTLNRKAGEITLFVIKVTTWERMQRELP